MAPIRIEREIHQHPFQAAQRPRRLEDGGDGHADDPILVFEIADDARGIGVEFRAGGIGRLVGDNRGVIGQRVADDLGVVARAERRFVGVRPPADAPFVHVLIGVLVVRIRPADRGQQHIFAERAFELVGVAAAVRIVDLLPLERHIRAQPVGEFRREADLHGTAVRLLLVECGPQTLCV